MKESNIKRPPIDIDVVRKLEKEFENTTTNKWISVCVTGYGVFALVASYFLNTRHDPISIGILLGGGTVILGINYYKSQKILRKLDNLCYCSFGKAYKLSRCDLFKVRPD